MTVPVGGGLQGWFPLTRLPWNLPAVPGICTGPPPTVDGTSSQAHQLAMSLNWVNTGWMTTFSVHGSKIALPINKLCIHIATTKVQVILRIRKLVTIQLMTITGNFTG